jgi:putative tryptophan/tyrosine transport system substrate-binding protein
MKRREFIPALGGAVAWPGAARAQQPAMPVVAFIDTRSSTSYEPFVRGLIEVGFIDHSNVLIEHREADHVDQLPAIGVDLVQSKVAVICGPTNAIIAAKAVTSTVPMVFIGGTDPVAVGLVASFNRPGGNITGVRLIAGELPSKQIEVLHELVPGAIKVGLLISPQFTDAEPQAAVALEAAHRMGMVTIVERVMAENEFEAAFTRFVQEHVGAILIVPNVFFRSYRDRLGELALRQNLPTLTQSRDSAIAGALASYGPSTPDLIRQAGNYVGRILKGEKPGDLPVLQPTKFYLVINLKTAKALGLDVPPSLLARADEVIE